MKIYEMTEEMANIVIPDVVLIPRGTFAMGSSDDEKNSCSDERPQHQVTVPSFFMGKYPVTQAQWEAVASQTDMKVKIDLNPDPSYFKGKNHPVERVSWDEAVEFCQRLSRLTGGNYRLPSEAEWEYACRAGTTTRFYFGDEVNQLEDYAWHGENSRGTTHPVGQKKPNAWGLYDMHGNVWEWCEDDWHDSYEGAPTDGSAWIENGNCHRVTRGGSWFKHPEDCLSASRDYDHRRANHLNDYGFRVVRGGSCRVSGILPFRCPRLQRPRHLSRHHHRVSGSVGRFLV